MALSHVKKVDGVNYQIAQTKMRMKTQDITLGVTNFSNDNVFTGKRTDRLALAMVNDAAMR